MNKTVGLIVTCEHGGNRVPAEYAPLFRGMEGLLASPKAYDFGALELAKSVSAAFRCPLYFSTITRLLVDLNRSEGNPRRFSKAVRVLSPNGRERISERYYKPFRDEVLAEMRRLLSGDTTVLHVSVHSFEPVLREKRVKADVGLLYDPKRKRESVLCSLWRNTLLKEDNSIKLRRNYPYLGVSDGHVTHLRKVFGEDSYIGVEIEVNERFPRGDRRIWLGLMRRIASSLKSAIASRP